MSPTSSRKSAPPLAYSNLPHAIGAGVGKCALDVTKQLALENVLAERGAVQSDKGPLLARAILMNRLCDQLFSRTGVALNKHGRVGWRDAPKTIDHVMHRRAIANYAFEAKLFVEAAI